MSEITGSAFWSAAACLPGAKAGNVRLAVEAVAPIIREDERRRVAERIRAERDKSVRTLDLMQARHNGRIRGLAIAAQIAERSGE